jgi:hypothetical protein
MWLQKYGFSEDIVSKLILNLNLETQLDQNSVQRENWDRWITPLATQSNEE